MEDPRIWGHLEVMGGDFFKVEEIVHFASKEGATLFKIYLLKRDTERNIQREGGDRALLSSGSWWSMMIEPGTLESQAGNSFCIAIMLYSQPWTKPLGLSIISFHSSEENRRNQMVFTAQGPEWVPNFAATEQILSVKPT